MKIFIALLAATAVAADHASLRHATSERVLTEPFNQQAVVNATENPNRNEPCIPGKFDENAMVVDGTKKQYPEDIPIEKQCR